MDIENGKVKVLVLVICQVHTFNKTEKKKKPKNKRGKERHAEVVGRSSTGYYGKNVRVCLMHAEENAPKGAKITHNPR